MNETDSLLNQLAAHSKRGHELLAKGPLKVGQVKLFLGIVCATLGKLFPRRTALVESFYPSSVSVSTANVTEIFAIKLEVLDALVAELEATASRSDREKRVFFGHGGSPIWRELKDYVHDDLGLPWEEFNREAAAGFTTFERLTDMLNSASFAFLIMTGEDLTGDNSVRARQNVVHEVGLFQGRLGPRRAIVLLEDGCEEFSNILGLNQIRFPRNHIRGAFHDVRRVLQREGLA